MGLGVMTVHGASGKYLEECATCACWTEPGLPLLIRSGLGSVVGLSGVPTCRPSPCTKPHSNPKRESHRHRHESWGLELKLRCKLTMPFPRAES
eukprot:4618470-Amphidinium_carterae.1